MEGKELVQLPVAQSATDFTGQFTLPDFTAIGNYQVYVVAITIAIIASLESLLSVEATISRMMTFRCPGVKFSEEDVNVEEEGVVSWNRRGFITPAPEDNLLRRPALFMFRKNNLIFDEYQFKSK